MIETDAKLIAYFPDVLGIDRIRSDVSRFTSVLKDAGLAHEIAYEYVFLSERDWNESWKKKFKPIEVGENLVVLPPWDKTETGRTTLVIDPGMAFGTGHHETTKTCLALIERLVPSVASKERFLDVGTGTGILAIAASKLGFREVTGVDIDPLAVEAARRNCEENGLDNIEITKGDISASEGAFDMLAANILSEVLLPVAPEIAARLRSPGLALLSGMLEGQEDAVIAALEREGLSLKEKIRDGRWVSIILFR
jgi:ribosomal protein L11 methyltransferase